MKLNDINYMNMETQLTLHTGRQTANGLSARFMNSLKQPVEALRKYYAAVLGRDISTRQTGLLVEAQVAFALTALPAESPLLLRAACCAWFALAVMRCRRALR